MKKLDRAAPAMAALGIFWACCGLAQAVITPLSAAAALLDARAGVKHTHRMAPLTRWGDDLADPDLGHVPGEILVKFRPDRPWAAIAEAAKGVRAQEVRVFPEIGVRHWRIADRGDARAALARLHDSPAARWIEYAEPNYVWHVDTVPNDPMRGDLYGMHNLGQTGLADADCDALEAWVAGYTGAASVVVGVIDTGIDYTHPDLAANMWTNPGETAGDGIDNDGNGYVDDVHGADFVNADGDPMDDNGHGSHTAGTIGAVGNNGIGVMGAAWNVKLMALKFLSAGGSGSTANAILAINYAKAKGAVITNNSWGGGQKSNALRDAIAASNALFVASAGNNGSSSLSYPAGYPSSNILSVAATDSSDNLAYYSNFSSTWVDLGAPGSDVMSTVPNGSYGMKSGTSMAAPHVSGAAALVWAYATGPAVSSVKNTLMNTVDPIPSLAGKCVTGGKLSVRKALGAPELTSDTTPPDPVLDLAATVNEQGEVILTWTASGDDGATGTAYLTDLRYNVVEEVTDVNFSSWPKAAGVPNGASGSPQSFIVPDARQGQTIYAALKVVDKAGNVSLISNAVSATVPAGLWNINPIDPVMTPGSSYIGFDYDPATGHPAIAYGDYNANTIYFTSWDGTEWSSREVVRSGYSGVSMEYDPLSGAPTLTSVPGKVYMSSKSGSSWLQTLVASGNNGRDISWLAYDPSGKPGVAYRGNGLLYAFRNGTTWSSQTVHQGAGARYMCLAFDENGRPGIAYSGDANGDGWLDSIWYAHHDGFGWSYEMVEFGPSGYGVHAAIAFNPVTQHPAVAHYGSSGAIRFLQWDGSSWQGETPFVSPDGYAWSCSIAFRDDGTALFATSADGWMRMLHRNPDTGEWTMEKVSSGDAFLFRMRVAPDGRIGLAYNDWDSGIVYAERTP